jgi:hypothetical protein
VLVTDTIPELLDKGLNKLHYDGRDLFENFSEVLGSYFQQPWREIAGGRPLFQRSEANFKLDLYKLLQTETGDLHFDQTLKDYLLHSANLKLIKPRETSPKDHASIMRSLINAYNAIPRTVAQTTMGECRICHAVTLSTIYFPEFSPTRSIDQVQAYLMTNPCRYDLIVGRDLMIKGGIDFS